MELSTAIRGEARLFYWTVAAEEAKKVDEIDLPKDSKIVCYYRKEQFHIAEPQNKLQKGDNVVVLTHSKNLDQLQEKYTPNKNNEG